MEEQFQYDVFLSHSSKDKEITDRVCKALEDKNIKCWIAPRDIVPGSEWGESIIEAIHQSKIMILVFSSASNNSKQVARELESAIRKSLYIIPFRVENVDPTGSMEYYLYTQHWLDAFSGPIEKHIDKLVSNVEHYLRTGKPDEPVIAQKPKATASPKLETATGQKPKGLKNRWALTGIALAVVAALTITAILLVNGAKNRENPSPGTNLQAGNMDVNSGLLSGGDSTGSTITPLPSPEGKNENTQEPASGTAAESTAAAKEGGSGNTPSGQFTEHEITQTPVISKQPEQASATGSVNTDVKPTNTPIPQKTVNSALSEGNASSPASGGGNVSATPAAKQEPAANPVPMGKPVFDDKKLEAVIRKALGKPTGDITADELAGLTELNATDKGITSINGLQYLTNLEVLYINANEITDLEPIKSLVKLRELIGAGNKITSLKPVGNLKNLQMLYMCWNSFTDLSPLSGLSNLRELSFGACGVSDISPLASLTQLEILRMYDNNITDLSPLSGMTKLQHLSVEGNPVTDFTPVEKLNIPELIKD